MPSRLSGLAVGLTLAVGLAVTAAAQTYSFTAISVQGNQRISDGTVLEFADLPTGQSVSVAQVNAAQSRVRNSGLFESVTVNPQGNTLVITVEEYPTINQISIEGNRRLDNDVLLGLIESQSRRVYSPTTAQSDAEAISEAYFNAGRLAATVNPQIIPRSQNRVDLVFEITESAVTEIERISFVGNRNFSDRRLRSALQTRQAGFLRQFIGSDTYIPERVEFDRQLLTDFYRSRGYIDFEILSVTPEFARERDAFFLTFRVQEGPRYSIADVGLSSQVTGLDLTDFNGAIQLETGQIYSPTRIENSVARLERRAIEEGYNFIRANPQIERNPRNQTLDVTFVLERGPRVIVERIDIEGNTNTLDRVVRRQFDVVEGDPFNPREIRNSAERIRSLGYFASTDVTTREGTAADRVIVDVNVEEQPTGSISLGAAYSLDQGVGLNFGLRERNFLGRGQQFNLQLSAGIDNTNYRFTFTEPALLGRNVAGTFDAYYRTSDNANSAYDTEVLGTNPSLSFPVSDNGRLSLNLLVERNEISDVTENSSAIIQREEGELTTVGVGYTYSWDTQRGGLDPVNRYRFRFGQTFAGLADTDYIRTSAAGTYNTSVLNEDVGLSATLSGDALTFLSEESRVIDRYFGGSRIRGFRGKGMGPRDLEAENEDALGGNYRVAFSTEVDFPVGLPQEYGIRGGLFYDIGSVWGLDDTEGTNGVEVDDDFYLRQVVGASIFWETPIGPLRFNFTRAIQKEDYDEDRFFDFRISTRF